MPIYDGPHNHLDHEAEIRVVGIGGSGARAVESMIAKGLEGVDFLVADTDASALASSSAPTKVLLGTGPDRGGGSRGVVDLGREAAIESVGGLREALGRPDFVLVVAGMGGATGTGAAPIVARVSRELGALTVGVVTTPSVLEGEPPKQDAEAGVAALERATDATFVLPGDGLLATSHGAATVDERYAHTAETTGVVVQGLTDAVTQHGMICFDFNDFWVVLPKPGHARVASGSGRGTDGPLAAAEEALSSPLLGGLEISKAQGIFINFTGGIDVKLRWIQEAVNAVQQASGEDTDIVFVLTTHPDMKDAVRLTLFATGMQVDADGPRQ